MNQNNLVRNVTFIAIAVVSIGSLGYLTFAQWSGMLPQQQTTSPVVTTEISTTTTTTTTSVTTSAPTPTPAPKPVVTAPAKTDGWTWTNLGCGSQSPCSYNVCSATTPALCYFCRGKYDSTTSAGERLPMQNEDPRTTSSFTCVQKS